MADNADNKETMLARLRQKNLILARIDQHKQALDGFRSTFTSLCYANYAPFEAVEGIIDHKVGSHISRISNKADLKVPKCKLIQWSSDYTDSLRNGKG